MKIVFFNGKQYLKRRARILSTGQYRVELNKHDKK